MADASDNMKWTISQVERLICLPRRHIQRCCYKGKGGVNLVQPKESEWGHRYYEVEDIALLYLVACLRDEGKSLPEAKEIIESQQNGGASLEDMLLRERQRLEEQLEEIQARLTRAKALEAALSNNPDENLKTLIDEGKKIVESQTNRLENLVDLPDYDLVLELKYGCGSSEN